MRCRDKIQRAIERSERERKEREAAVQAEVEEREARLAEAMRRAQRVINWFVHGLIIVVRDNASKVRAVTNTTQNPGDVAWTVMRTRQGASSQRIGGYFAYALRREGPNWECGQLPPAVESVLTKALG